MGEVISRAGMEAYGAEINDCKEHNMQGPVIEDSDEDVFLTHCLDKVGVSKVSSTSYVKLLSEEHCFPFDAPSPCKSGVAFHPFKTPDTYFVCLAEAER